MFRVIVLLKGKPLPQFLILLQLPAAFLIGFCPIQLSINSDLL